VLVKLSQPPTNACGTFLRDVKTNGQVVWESSDLFNFFKVVFLNSWYSSRVKHFFSTTTSGCVSTSLSATSQAWIGKVRMRKEGWELGNWGIEGKMREILRDEVIERFYK
jgi:hypothetical protein